VQRLGVDTALGLGRQGADAALRDVQGIQRHEQ
jgi:hypothetical protein